MNTIVQEVMSSVRRPDSSPAGESGLGLSPPTTPMKRYSCSTVLQKEAATRPEPARQPPKMMIGRLPNRFTRMLLIGPEEETDRRRESISRS